MLQSCFDFVIRRFSLLFNLACREHPGYADFDCNLNLTSLLSRVLTALAIQQNETAMHKTVSATSHQNSSFGGCPRFFRPNKNRRHLKSGSVGGASNRFSNLAFYDFVDYGFLESGANGFPENRITIGCSAGCLYWRF